MALTPCGITDCTKVRQMPIRILGNVIHSCPGEEAFLCAGVYSLLSYRTEKSLHPSHNFRMNVDGPRLTSHELNTSLPRYLHWTQISPESNTEPKDTRSVNVIEILGPSSPHRLNCGLK